MELVRAALSGWAQAVVVEVAPESPALASSRAMKRMLLVSLVFLSPTPLRCSASRCKPGGW